MAIPLLLGVKLNDDDIKVYDYVRAFNSGVDDFGGFDTNIDIPCPPELIEAIEDDWWICAHNAGFEYWVTNNSPAIRHWPKIRHERLICTAAKARYYGFPGKLELAADALNLPIQKLKEGKRLIRKFCVPQKTARSATAPKYIKTIDPLDPDWALFRDVYCHDDVGTEYWVDTVLPDIPDKYIASYYMDFRMNERGFPVDAPSITKAKSFFQYFNRELMERFHKLSGGLAPTQVAKVRELLNDDYHCGLPDLTAETIRDKLLEDDFFAPEAKEMLEIRQESAKSSISKLDAFECRTAADGRSRGGFLWYGAHTGRWSGYGIQPQNFPRGITELMALLPAFYAWLEQAESPPSKADLATAALVFPNPLGVLSSGLRGLIKAEPGDRLLAVDYAQIELRVLAWIAGESDLLDQLRAGLDPYIEFAATHMYGIDPSEVTPLQRQIAKSALLGAQYQIWVYAFIEYCAKQANLKITLEESTRAILSYRSASPNIVEFWGDIEKAAIFAVTSRGEALLNNIRLRFEEIKGREFLRMYLPNGRPISYPYPEVRERITEAEKKDKDGNIVLGTNGVPITYTKKKKVLSFLTYYQGRVMREYTYGGKLTENMTQGCAAEIMSYGMINAEKAGYLPVMTIHDENVVAAKEGFGSVKELCELMCDLPKCYDGLPIKAEGKESIRYTKG